MGSPRVTLVLLGVATTVAQAVLVREAMTALGGSELAWGGMLALWLAGVGLGARLGASFGSVALARVAAPAVLLLAGAGTCLLRATPLLVGAAPGEAVTTWGALWVWPLAALPAGLAGGIAFPLLAGCLGPLGAGEGYAAEAAGALSGGVAFSLALAPLGSAAALGLTLGLVVAVELWPRRRLLALLALLLAATTAAPASRALASATWRWAARPGDLAHWAETRHQRLELADTRPAALYANGRLAATYPDPWGTVPQAHLLLLLHPAPRRVLAVGATADGTVVTALAHPLERLTLAEEDPALLRLLPRWYGPGFARSLADPRLDLTARDPRRALEKGAPFDLVLLLDGDPTTLRANRTRTVEFFARCRASMAEGAVLVVRTAVSDTYLGGAGGRYLETLAVTLGRVFPRVLAIPGERVTLVAATPSADPRLDPGLLAARWRERALADPAFTPELLPLLLDRSRLAALNDFVERASAPANTTDRPRAVLLAAGLAEARGHPPLLRLARSLAERPPTPLAAVLAVAVALLLALPFTRRSPAPAAAAVVGFSSLAWWLLLLGVWQAAIGSVYAEIGALSAAFMAGILGGAAGVRSWRKPERRLAPLLALGALLSLGLAAGLPQRAPLVAVPAFLLAGGLLTGAAFAGLARLSAPRDPRRGSGLGFAADELGAAAAALVVGVVALPWAGLAATAAGLAALELAAVPAVLRAARR